MSRYLGNLIGRTQQTLPVLRPRPVSMFEAPHARDEGLVESTAVSTLTPARTPDSPPKPKVTPLLDNAPKAEDVETDDLNLPSSNTTLTNVQAKPDLPSLKFKQASELPTPPSKQTKAVDKRPFSPQSQKRKPVDGTEKPQRSQATPSPQMAGLMQEPTSLPEIQARDTLRETAVTPLTPERNALPSLPTAKEIDLPETPITEGALLAKETPQLVMPMPAAVAKSRQKLTETTVYPPSAILPPKEQPPAGQGQRNGRSLLAATPAPNIPAGKAAVVNLQPPGAPAAPSLQEASATPTIHVKIGRIEVRAPAANEQPAPTKKERQNNVLSLNDYLKQRQGASHE